MKAQKVKTVITIPCECGSLTATVQKDFVIEERKINKTLVEQTIAEVAFCDGCGIANIL